MNAADQSLHGWRLVLDYTPFPDLRKGLREQWLSPVRTGVNRWSRHGCTAIPASSGSGTSPAAAWRPPRASSASRTGR